MRFSAPDRLGQAIFASLLLLLLVLVIGMPAARSEAKIAQFELEIQPSRLAASRKISLEDEFVTSEIPLKQSNVPLAILRGKLKPAPLIKLYSVSLTASQQLKVIRLQGEAQSDQFLSMVGLDSTVRKQLCGEQLEARSRLYFLSKERADRDKLDFSVVWPELRGELRKAAEDASKQALAAACAFESIY